MTVPPIEAVGALLPPLPAAEALDAATAKQMFDQLMAQGNSQLAGISAQTFDAFKEDEES